MIKFGHMSSDLLAYGASDGTLTVCSVSEKPSVIKQLNGHSKDITGRIYQHWFIGLYLILHNIHVHECSKSISSNILIFKWGFYINKSFGAYFQFPLFNKTPYQT